jgi:soluble lytic murein transglycosylase
VRVQSLVLSFVVLALPAALGAQSDQGAPSAAADAVNPLAPTAHPRLPEDQSRLWMVPEKPRGGQLRELAGLAQAVKLIDDSQFAKALPLLTAPALRHGDLADYATYYRGICELRLDRAADARNTFRDLQQRQLVGYLVEGAALGEAEADEALNDPGSAAAIYERLSKTSTTSPDDVLMRLGRAAATAGDTDRAASAFERVYYEFPMSDLAQQAGDALASLPNVQPIEPGNERYKLEMERAERLFGARKYADAREGYERLQTGAQGDTRELVQLRLAECDYFLRQPRRARDGVMPFIDHASRQAEALFFYAVASRQLGDQDEYLKTVRRLVDQFPGQSWAEEALNNLASRYIIDDDDEQAVATFRELYAKFPDGRYAERAAWKIGWWAYKSGDYAETIQVFERAAARFPRSDYRPAWLYWAGRAHTALDQPSLADERFTLVASDYLNSYYGRLAMNRLKGQSPQLQTIADRTTADTPAIAPPPPNEHVIRVLLGLELYDDAERELRYAQRAWGDTPPVRATLAWVFNQRGDLRAGINAMKRAYPQYMAAGGEDLPTSLLKVLFPIDYWTTIRRYSLAHELDPYLIAALIAQESTFEVDVKSAANAYGLMQLLPSTGRHYARKLGFRRFTRRMLTTAETNIRMGTAYFADLVQQFGGAHFALASYNAGENRVERWISERPGVDREEFIDDIPFPETQNYVKKVLGTAEDYRRLYGPAGAEVSASGPHRPRPAAPLKATHGGKKKVSKASSRKKPTTAGKKVRKKKQKPKGQSS